MEAIKLIIALGMFLFGQISIIWMSKNIKLLLVTKTTINKKVYISSAQEDYYRFNIFMLMAINGDYYVIVTHLLRHSLIIDIFAFFLGGMVMVFITAGKMVFAERKIKANEVECSVAIITMSGIIVKESQMKFY